MNRAHSAVRKQRLVAQCCRGIHQCVALTKPPITRNCHGVNIALNELKGTALSCQCM